MRTVEIKDLTKDFETAHDLVESILRKNRVSDVVIDETMLIFEALCHNIFEQNEDTDIVLKVTGSRRFGSVGIKLNYDGRMYISDRDAPGEPTPEDRILTAYGDRIDYIYRSRFNSIRIQARRSYVGSTMAYLAAVFLAILVYSVMHMTASAEAEASLRENLIFPLETLFANAMLMIGAPVTFLSLLKNLTGIYILSERDSGIRKITKQTIVSSINSTIIALAACWLVSNSSLVRDLSINGYEELRVHMKLSEFITELLPSDIFTPFQTISPFPLILLAAMMTYAFCSVGKYFDSMMHAIKVAYALFSRLLAIVMYLLPIFAFCAVMDVLLKNGYGVLLSFGKILLLVIASIILPVIYYALRLAVGHIYIPGFVRRMRPLLSENFKIASVIDAVPFNVRYCTKYFGLDRKTLETNLPILAQVNLDGNCYLLTFISLLFVIISGSGASPDNMLLVGMLIFVLSLGAPNQPGSCIIGILIILHYLEAYTFIPYAIFAEIFFGAVLNLMNVTGDIVTVVADEKPDLRDQ